MFSGRKKMGHILLSVWACLVVVVICLKMNPHLWEQRMCFWGVMDCYATDFGADRELWFTVRPADWKQCSTLRLKLCSLPNNDQRQYGAPAFQHLVHLARARRSQPFLRTGVSGHRSRAVLPLEGSDLQGLQYSIHASDRSTLFSGRLPKVTACADFSIRRRSQYPHVLANAH